MSTGFQSKYLAVGFLVAIAAACTAEDVRARVDLDGVWSFRMDPREKGESERWFEVEQVFEDTVQVPGAWDAQGKGAESDKLEHQFLGKAWYKRQVLIPDSFAGHRAHLCFSGIHRYAVVWVNGTRLGEHVGYLSPFEFDVTRYAKPGTRMDITVRVDSVQNWDIDALIGAMDMIDYMDTYWGGIYGHVTLEARNEAYLSDLFVAPKVGPQRCEVQAAVHGSPPAGAELCVEVIATGGTVVAESRIDAPADAPVKVSVDSPHAAVWTPDSPVLYTARASLVQDGKPIDAIEARFGFREIVLEGERILLNGKRFFLRGYGDDSIFPETMAPPADKEFYLKRLAVAKEFGFNYVRHHSTMLPQEYYDACDEVGMFVSAEFPVAYPQFYARAKGAALDLMRTEWAAAVRKLRNHPSIFNWCMGNEVSTGMSIAPDLYKSAKELDPTRPVADTDGIPDEGYADGTKDRDTLDMYFIQFDVFNSVLENADFYKCPSPKKPVISHENGNYITFPRLDQIELFQQNIKPFWMIEAREKVSKMGLSGEVDLWAANSGKLYTLLHKLDKECLRKNANISGYHWWLFQDYWTTSNGLVDTYFRLKPGMDRDTVRKFNAPIVLLLDGIDLVYRGGGKLKAKFAVSNFGDSRLDSATLAYSVTLGNEKLIGLEQVVQTVAQGTVGELASTEVELPPVEKPCKVLIAAELRAGDLRVANDWYTWVYPPEDAAAPISAHVGATPDLCPWLKSLGINAMPTGQNHPPQTAYFVSYLPPEVIAAVSEGACAILYKPTGFVEATRTRFKTAWWKGGDKDTDAGTVVYEHPVTLGMAPEGWCDTSWYGLIEGSDGYLIDELPVQPNVLIRGIEAAGICRNKALLFEIGLGKGSLIVCGLNLDAKRQDGAADPAAEWLTARLIEYAATLPKAAATIPEQFVQQYTDRMTELNAPHIQGFSRLLRNDGEEGSWFTYRHNRANAIICRQTETGHLVEWLTDRAPESIGDDSVTFVFAGGLGWLSEPAGGGFVLLVNGKDTVHFDVCRGQALWRDKDSGVELCLLPRRNDAEDQAGLFYVRVPVTMLEPGSQCRLGVRSNAQGSKRWFALHPYTDVVNHLGMP